MINNGNPLLPNCLQLLQHHQDSHRRSNPLNIGCRKMDSTLSWNPPECPDPLWSFCIAIIFKFPFFLPTTSETYFHVRIFNPLYLERQMETQNYCQEEKKRKEVNGILTLGECWSMVKLTKQRNFQMNFLCSDWYSPIF